MSSHHESCQFGLPKSRKDIPDGHTQTGGPGQSSSKAEPPLHNAPTYLNTYCSDDAFVVQGNLICNEFHHHVAKETVKPHGEENQTYGKAERNKDRALVNSLRFPGMNERFWTVDDASPNTCQWFFKHEAFVQWRDDSKIRNHNGCLLMKAKPGFGKSTLMKLLCENTQKFRPEEITLFYFFDSQVPGELVKSSLGVYRALVHQILDVSPVAKEVFLRRFSTKRFTQEAEEWSATELQSFLRDFLTKTEHPPINIFIDGLDEGAEDDVRQLVSFLKRLSDQALLSSSKLLICLSSRYYPNFNIPNGLQVTLDDEAQHMKDIQTYTRNSLHPGLHALQRELCRKSAGVFLWVILVVSLLNTEFETGGSLERARALLNSLPTHLNTLFTDILVRSTKNMRECVTLLHLVLFSEEPLKPLDLYVAMQYCIEPSSLLSQELPDETHLHSYILNHSRGLVEMTLDLEPVVRFIHRAVRTFLLSEHGLQQVDPDPQTNIEKFSHEQLKRACCYCIKHNKLAFHELDDNIERNFPRNQPCQENLQFLGAWIADEHHHSMVLRHMPPFTEYAAKHLFAHANTLQRLGASQTNFLETVSNDNVFESWRLFHNFLHFVHGKRKYCENTTLLYIATDQKLWHMLQCLVYNGMNVNARGGFHGFPLQAACAAGNVESIRLLLKSGADPNMEGGKYGNAFRAALSADIAHTSDIIILLQRHGGIPFASDLIKAFLKSISSGISRRFGRFSRRMLTPT